MKFIVIANSLPITKKEIEIVASNHKIIALDGIANQLLPFDIIPYAIIGDFDSISQESVAKAKQLEIQLHIIDNQNTTDLEKGIEFCKQNGATEIVILNSLGGDRLDHSLMNYRILKQRYSKQHRIKIKDKQSYLELFVDTTLKISGIPKANIALFSAPRAIINSQGLKYDMQNYKIEFGISESASNSLQLEQATIHIQGSAFLIYNASCKVDIII